MGDRVQVYCLLDPDEDVDDGLGGKPRYSSAPEVLDHERLIHRFSDAVAFCSELPSVRAREHGTPPCGNVIEPVFLRRTVT